MPELERWGLLVPYLVTGHLYEGHPGGERIQPGAFALAITHHASRLTPMTLVDGHHRQGRGGGRLGWVMELDDRAVGLAGLVRFDDTPAGRAGWIRSETEGLSAEYLATRERVGRDGVRDVLAAQLHRVALTPRPAYRGAAFMITNETGPRP